MAAFAAILLISSALAHLGGANRDDAASLAAFNPGESVQVSLAEESAPPAKVKRGFKISLFLFR